MIHQVQKTSMKISGSLQSLGHLQGIGLDHLFGRKIGGSLDDVVPTHEHHFLVPQLEDSLT